MSTKEVQRLSQGTSKKKCSINTNNWETLACKRSNWRTAFAKGVMLELRMKGRNVLRGRHAWQTLTMINSHPETYVPTVEGHVDPELASTVTYELTVKTVFVEDNLNSAMGKRQRKE